jgi:hypothetical protein
VRGGIEIAAIILANIALWFAWFMHGVVTPPKDFDDYGDWVALPDEAKARRRNLNAGGRAVNAASALRTDDVRTRHNGSVTP